MLDPMTFRVADIARTKAFYAACLAPLGYEVVDPHGNNVEAVCQDPA